MKRKGAFGLALFFALASGDDISGVEEKLKRNGDQRAKIAKKRLKAREARQQRRLADQLADAFVLAEGAKQARFDGLLLPVVPPAYRAAVESIVASSNVRLSEEGHVPGFAKNRLIETIRASDLGWSAQNCWRKLCTGLRKDAAASSKKRLRGSG